MEGNDSFQTSTNQNSLGSTTRTSTDQSKSSMLLIYQGQMGLPNNEHCLETKLQYTMLNRPCRLYGEMV